jgi:hypothetical protein
MTWSINRLNQEQRIDLARPLRPAATSGCQAAGWATRPPFPEREPLETALPTLQAIHRELFEAGL